MIVLNVDTFLTPAIIVYIAQALVELWYVFQIQRTL